MGFSVYNDVTAPYSKMESWFYDTFVAPAMAHFYDRMEGELEIDPPPKATFLDVGCGGGHILAKAATKWPEGQFFGVDLSEEQVVRAEKRLANFNGRVIVREGSALSLPYAPDKFDILLSTGSIKHWPDQALGLSECVRVLKPKGRLLVIEADRGCRLDDVDRLFAQTKIPRFLRFFFQAIFLTNVAGPSLDLDDVRGLAANLSLSQCSVSRIQGLPGWVLDGIK